jgi:Fur family ferric uptake transcriptional regulator/Fur family zinc uptake transcriptional regulator
MRSEPSPAFLIEKAGLRATEVRERVLSELRKAERPLSHPELAALLAGLDRVTVFRSLKALKAKGLLHSVQGVDGLLRYVANPEEARGCPGGHPHFLCEGCGAMVCLPGQAMPRIEVPRGSVVSGKQLLAYGLCPACAARDKKARRKGEFR